MDNSSLTFIFINTAIINNFVLATFLGICPFLGVSAKKATAFNMGLATTIVMGVSSICAYAINWVLVTFHIEFLQLIAYITMIAAVVQVVEMVIKKTSPLLFRALGIYLPLITTNCVVLAVAIFQTNRNYNFLQGLVLSLSGGVGFTLALMLMSGLREKLELADLPAVSRSMGLVLILAGMMSLAFMGFAGLGGSNG